ncbi:MAG: transglutaminase-like domain-containing protein [Bacteroidia bacterium]|nr:transglutaminase-like domain-containing protein [Bacteroidia bacterium]
MAVLQAHIQDLKGTRIRVSSHMRLHDTLSYIQQATRDSLNDVEALADFLDKGDFMATAEALYEYLVKNVRYKLDTSGTEEIRTAARSLADARTGVDCEDYSILAAAIMYRLGYEGHYEVIRQQGKPAFHHIYYVAHGPGGQEALIDPTPDLSSNTRLGFNRRPANIVQTMSIHILSGLNHQAVSNSLAGLGNVLEFGTNPPTDTTRALMNQQTALLSSSIPDEEKAPQLRKLRFYISLNGSREQQMFLDLDPAIGDISPEGEILWREGTDLEAVAEYVESFEGSSLGDQGFGDLGFVRNIKDRIRNSVRGAGGKLKSAAKKAGSFGKKVVSKVNSINPATMAARTAFRLAMVQDFAGIASTIKWGYLSEAAARQKDFDMEEWNKLRQAIEKVENTFRLLGGKPENIRQAIIQGGKGLQGLGAVAAIPIILKAAASFLQPIMKFIKEKINVGKLLNRVEKAKQISSKINTRIADARQVIQTFSRNPQDNQPAQLDPKLNSKGPEGKGFNNGFEEEEAMRILNMGSGDGNEGSNNKQGNKKPLIIAGAVVGTLALVGGFIYLSNN